MKKEKGRHGLLFFLIVAAYLSRYLNLSYFITSANINARINVWLSIVNLKDSNGKKINPTFAPKSGLHVDADRG